MQVFYVNIGGGEPTIRPDFWELRRLRHRPPRRREVLHQRQSGSRPRSPAALAANDYVDVQISLDGATAEVNDAVRGAGSYATAIARHGEPGRRRVRAASSSRSSAPGRTSTSSTRSRRSPTATAPSCA